MTVTVKPLGEVRLTLIGGFALNCGGSSVRLPMGSQRVIAYLALHDLPLLRLHVAGALWTDAAEGRSYANLRGALWRIRGPAKGVVEATTSHIGLSREVRIDVREMVAAAQRLMQPPGGEQRAPVELAQLSDDLLPDWYDDWVLLRRERLRQLRLHALEELADRWTCEGRFGHAIDTALAAVAADPLRESAHRVLIRAYRAEGNVGAAIRQYREYCRRAADELGLEPSPKLRALVGDLAV